MPGLDLQIVCALEERFTLFEVEPCSLESWPFPYTGSVSSDKIGGRSSESEDVSGVPSNITASPTIPENMKISKTWLISILE